MSAFDVSLSPSTVSASTTIAALSLELRNNSGNSSTASRRPPSIVQVTFSFDIGEAKSCLLQSAADWDQVEAAVIDTGRVVPETLQPYSCPWTVDRSATATSLTYTLRPTRSGRADYIVPGSALKLLLYLVPISAATADGQPMETVVHIAEQVTQHGAAVYRQRALRTMDTTATQTTIRKTVEPPSLQGIRFTAPLPANGSSISIPSLTAAHLPGAECRFAGYGYGLGGQGPVVYHVPFMIPPQSAGLSIDSVSFQLLAGNAVNLDCDVVVCAAVYRESDAGNAQEDSDSIGSWLLLYSGQAVPFSVAEQSQGWTTCTVPVTPHTALSSVAVSNEPQYLYVVLYYWDRMPYRVDIAPHYGVVMRAWQNTNRLRSRVRMLCSQNIWSGGSGFAMQITSHRDVHLSNADWVPCVTLKCTQIKPPLRVSPYVTSVPRNTEVRAVILSNIEGNLMLSVTSAMPIPIESRGSSQPIYYPPSNDIAHHLIVDRDQCTAIVSDDGGNQKEAAVTSYDAVPLFARCYSAPVCNVLDQVSFESLDTRWLEPKLRVVNANDTTDVDEYPWQDTEAFFKAVKSVHVYILANSSAAQYSSVGQHISVCDPRLWTFTIALSADRSTLKLSWDWEPDQSTQTCSGGVTVQFDSATRRRWVQLLVPASMNASQYSISSSTIAPRRRLDVSTDLVYTVELQTYRTDVTCRITPSCSTTPAPIIPGIDLPTAIAHSIPNVCTALVYPSLDQPRPAQAMFSARQSVSHFDTSSKQYVGSYYILGLSFGLKKASSGASATLVNLLGACFSGDGSGAFSSDKVEPPYDASTNQPVVVNTSATDATLHLYPRLPGQSTPAVGYALYRLDCDVLVDKSGHGSTSRLLRIKACFSKPNDPTASIVTVDSEQALNDEQKTHTEWSGMDEDAKQKQCESFVVGQQEDKMYYLTQLQWFFSDSNICHAESGTMQYTARGASVGSE